MFNDLTSVCGCVCVFLGTGVCVFTVCVCGGGLGSQRARMLGWCIQLISFD